MPWPNFATDTIYIYIFVFFILAHLDHDDKYSEVAIFFEKL